MSGGSESAQPRKIAGLVPRALTHVVLDRMRDEPVVMLEGARAVGKSTLLADVASALGARILDLDDPATRRSVHDDPSYAISGDSPVCIDEYQQVPDVLQAIKAELNRDTRPGRFLLTGSASRDTLPPGTQTLTGRLHVIPVRPLSQAELNATSGLLGSIVQGNAEFRSREGSLETRADYAQAVVAGGFPLSLARDPVARNRWLDNHVNTALRRDTTELANIRQAASLGPLFQHLAAQTAQPLNVAAIARRIELDQRTATNYVHLLEQLFLVERLPAWGRTLRSRVSATPKLHLVDSGIAARMLRFSPERLLSRDLAAMTEFGHLLETLAYGELAAQASWLDGVTLGHYRTRAGEEVDIVAEASDGRIFGFEIKASSTYHERDFAGLRALRDLVGGLFAAGVVFYLGDRSSAALATAGEGMYALPLDRLWLG